MHYFKNGKKIRRKASSSNSKEFKEYSGPYVEYIVKKQEERRVGEMSNPKHKGYKIEFSPDDNEVNLYRGQGIITFGVENVITASIKILNRLEEENAKNLEANAALKNENNKLQNLVIELTNRVGSLESENKHLRFGNKNLGKDLNLEENR